jgi:hypothetical protein
MRILWILLALSTTFAAPAVAQSPQWAETEGRKALYPESAYFTGFGMAALQSGHDKAECLQRAAADARRDLIEGIRVSVRSEFIDKAERKGLDSTEHLYSSLQTQAQLELQGLRTETFAEGKTCSALAIAKREDTARLYAEKESRLYEDLRLRFDAARRSEGAGDKGKALNGYLSCYPVLRQAQEAATIAFLARGGKDAAPAPESRVSFAALRAAVERLSSRPVESADDLAWALAFQLSEQSVSSGARVMVAPFSYKDTGMASPFSRFLRQSLQRKLADTVAWKIVEGGQAFQPKTRDIAREYAESSGAEYALAGSYWPEAAGVKIIATLRRVSDGSVAAGAEASAPHAAIKASGQSLEPQNFKDAALDQRVFAHGEIQGGGLTLEAWTNKGGEDLVFSKGELMKVYVRVNLPSHVRLLYQLADRRKVLLLDDYFVDASKVNRVYEIPQEFECDAPFGAEFLQAFASTEPFEPLGVEKKDGYDVVVGDLGAALVKTRGMKKASPKVLRTETRLILTTLDK